MKKLMPALFALTTLLVASCQTGDDGASTGTRGSDTPGTSAVGQIVVYMFFDGYPVEPGPYLVPVSRPGPGDLAATISALLDGVTPSEADSGLSSAIPEDTLLLGVEVSGGVAQVDLSGAFESGGGSLSVIGRLSQLVYTITRFEDVDAVALMIDGETVEVFSGEGLVIDRPQRRSDYEGTVPAVLLEEPVWGAKVGSRLTIAGVANTKSPVYFRLIDAGGAIAASGEARPAGSGSFAVTVDALDAIEAGRGSIVVFQLEPDGRQIHVLQYPVSFQD